VHCRAVGRSENQGGEVVMHRGWKGILN
jgi:hypothetical protein